VASDDKSYKLLTSWTC